MRSTLALLLLFGAGIGVVTATLTCTTGPTATLPTVQEELCEHTIIFSATNNKQARDECHKNWLDFPKTHVKGQMIDAASILCTVFAKPQCELYTLPSGKTSEEMSCEATIDYRARGPDQALATCLEYFPTTFVKGEQTAAGMTKCIVTAAYQCVDPEMVLIFDKCYYFPKETSGAKDYIKGTVAEYQNGNKCEKDGNTGKLSVFYSYTHAKFVGMEAHRRNIDKLWIGIDKEGKEIEGEKLMMHPKMWKLVDDDYWDGDKPKKITIQKIKDVDGKNWVHNVKDPNFPPYYFMRTRTDHVYNRWQGHFERASANVKATFACEFKSVFTANQGWYCDKLPILGIDAAYDDGNAVTHKKPPRCLYVSANAYSLKAWDKTISGSGPTPIDDLRTVKGCQEKPSDIHSAGIDDGTAHYEVYGKLKSKEKLRLAGYHVKNRGLGYKTYELKKCTSSSSQREELFLQWRYIDHHGKMLLPQTSLIIWDPKYPKNECSDFPGESTTLGVMNGKKIDIPPEVHAQAVCSLTFFQECENKKPCGDKLECTNSHTYKNQDKDPKFHGFFTCHCPGVDEVEKPPYTEDSTTKQCKWQGAPNECAWLHFFQQWSDKTQQIGPKPEFIVKGFDGAFISNGAQFPWPSPPEFPHHHNDKLDRVVVRDGCTLWIDRGALLDGVGYGSHHVPNAHDHSLGNEWMGAGASTGKCTCNF